MKKFPFENRGCFSSYLRKLRRRYAYGHFVSMMPASCYHPQHSENLDINGHWVAMTHNQISL